MSSNKSMPDIYRVCVIKKDHLNLLIDTCELPTPYVLEIAQTVNNPTQTQEVLYTALSQQGERIHPNMGFFKVPLQNIQTLLDLLNVDKVVVKSPANEVTVSEATVSNSSVRVRAPIKDSKVKAKARAYSKQYYHKHKNDEGRKERLREYSRNYREKKKEQQKSQVVAV